MLLAVAGLVRAETVYLKNGNKLTGKVLEESDDRIKLEVDVEGAGKAIMTIMKSRIDRIEAATTFDERLTAAEGLVVAEDFKAAETTFRDLVRSEPKNARARMGLAKALVGLYRYEEAVKTLEHYLLLVNVNRDVALMLYLAEQYLEARDYSAAKRTAREAGDLYPKDTSLQTAVAELIKRCDRVRTGTEQLRERQTAASAERERLIEARSTWDEKRGNHFDAVEMANGMEAWCAESNSKLILSCYLQAEAPRDDVLRFMAGGEPASLHRAVGKADFKLVVDEARWLDLYDHQKSVLLYGWYYQLKERYPNAWPVVNVVSMAEERGKEVEKRLARSSWDGRRDQVVVDRWTKENRDPGRPIRRIVK